MTQSFSLRGAMVTETPGCRPSPDSSGCASTRRVLLSALIPSIRDPTGEGYMLYLLFDSTCSSCSSVARRVTDLGRGRIAARSLQDPIVRARLAELRPGWTAEPFVLEETSEGARLFSGRAMRRRIVQEVGLRHGLELWRLCRDASAVRQPSRGMTRQRFLRRAAALAGGAALAGPATASAASRHGDGTSRATTELLGAGAPEMTRLRASGAVAEARRAFGDVDLSAALRVPATADNPETLVVSLNQDAALLLADPASTSETALVLQSAQTAAGLELTWKRPDGSALGTTRIDRDGRVTSVAASGATLVEGRRTSSEQAAASFVECFVACVGVSGISGCADECLTCALTRNIIACAKCAVCAGPEAITCARRCA